MKQLLESRPSAPQHAQRAQHSAPVSPNLLNQACVICQAPTWAHYDRAHRWLGCQRAVRHAGRLNG